MSGGNEFLCAGFWMTIVFWSGFAGTAEDFPKPYSSPCVEREEVFEFTEKLACKYIGGDKYEITFAVKSNCDVAAGIIDEQGKVVRHLGSGVLGSNAPAPFQRNSLKQTIYWNGKDDLDDYPKEPGKLRVQLRLGLKPVFDKRLGGTSGKNIPARVAGIVVCPDAAYVFSTQDSYPHTTLRKFDRDGNYVSSLLPPPRDLPESKLDGLTYIEYEPGKRGIQPPSNVIEPTVCRNGAGFGEWLAGISPGDNYTGVSTIQPVVISDRWFYTTQGYVQNGTQSLLHYIHTDGSTDFCGVKGVQLVPGSLHSRPRLASSPDGKRIYLGGASKHNATNEGRFSVHVLDPDAEGKASLFAGDLAKPGSDNAHFNGVSGIACDAQGRVYVGDGHNNRIQVFTGEGKYLRTIGIDRPNQVLVHVKTGALYVQHRAMVQGQSVHRITKLASFDKPEEEFHWDPGFSGIMALDSWSARPRLWIGGKRCCGLTIWEERAGKFEKIADFEAEARKEAVDAKAEFLPWSGQNYCARMVCDPTRERLYRGNAVYDLNTGEYLHTFKAQGGGGGGLCAAFCKRGYMHGQDGEAMRSWVWRLDPGRAPPSPANPWSAAKDGLGRPIMAYPECPYDYGEERGGCIGAIATKGIHRLGLGVQRGLGVNMRGEVAARSEINYAPKFQDETKELNMAGSRALTALGVYNEEGLSYDASIKQIKELEKRGEEVYFFKPGPGLPRTGTSIWTYDRTGELRKECALISGRYGYGVEIDEDKGLYFVDDHVKLFGDRGFLYGKGGTFGDPKDTTVRWPYTGIMVKAKPDVQCLFLKRNAPVPLDPIPDRAADVRDISFPSDDKDNKDRDCWVEGADWIYAGVLPLISYGCTCGHSRAHLDWYKRSYVPESYRHSIGILDANGNLIMHLGRFGNFDSAPGGKDGCKPGESDIGLTEPRFPVGTDNYLAFEDWGERFVILRLDYHAEETAPIRIK